MPIKAVIFDLDGVLYRGDQALPGAAEVVERLRHAGRRVMYATNNSTRTRQEYVTRLRGFGFECEIDDVVTSAWATARYIVQKGLRPRDPLVVGMEGFRTELRDAGVLDHEHAVPRPFTNASSPPADMVVVGLHQAVTYDDLAEAQRALMAGAPFIAANKDTAYPVEGGRLLPGAGAIVAALETASGRVAVCVGKPEPFMFQEALRRAGASGGEAIVVGDSLQTDVLAAHRVGAIGVLITTGVTSEAAATSGDGVRADSVIGSLGELLKLPVLADRPK
ncbi:MAG: HAD-IIA family hydrolase [Chloroflexi bacterium]|nr:MAG: HAD-IIA family hydrolase [Chloroflexota bacterium]